MANDLVMRLFGVNAAAALAVLAVLALRRAARAMLGAQAAYALWLIVPAAMAASLLPSRTVLIPTPAMTAPAGLAPLVPRGGFALAPLSAIAPHGAVAGPALDLSQAVAGVWLAGVVVSLILLVIGQRRALGRFGRIVPDDRDARMARASNPGVGPALLGAVRPRVIVPADFEARFGAREQAMILAHERTHLASGHALINGLVALIGAVNWFNPLIHLGARCSRVDQELACDAAVIGRFPGERQAYAEALLKTQLAFASLPLGCDWPVRSRSRLEERVEMLAQPTPGRLRMLAGVGAVSVLTAGAGVAAWAAEPPVAKAAPVAASSPDAVARLRAEQEAPRKRVPFDPGRFDKYVGDYELAPDAVFKVTRDGGRFYDQLTGQAAVEIYPESETKFFETVVAAQLSFVSDQNGKVKGLVLHQGGLEQYSPRITASAATRIEAELAARIRNNTPSPGTEASVRKWLLALVSGRPDYEDMTPQLAAAARAQWPQTSEQVKGFGALKRITFFRVSPRGDDIYQVDFEHAQAQVMVAPLTSDGKVSGRAWRVQPMLDDAAKAALAKRIEDNRPSPGTDAFLHQYLVSASMGQPDFSGMDPGLQATARGQWPDRRSVIMARGALKSLTFLRVSQEGYDIYDAVYAHGEVLWTEAPLNADGKESYSLGVQLP